MSICSSRSMSVLLAPLWALVMIPGWGGGHKVGGRPFGDAMRARRGRAGVGGLRLTVRGRANRLRVVCALARPITLLRAREEQVLAVTIYKGARPRARACVDGLDRAGLARDDACCLVVGT